MSPPDGRRWLRCCRCRRVASVSPGEAPGDCGCGVRHPFPWIVLPSRPPALPEGFLAPGRRGFVRVLRGDGAGQELTRAGGWQEDPGAWERPPPWERG